jgi:hypothetical protein
MMAALYRAHGDGIDHQPRFRACLDREQPTEFLELCHR